MTFLLMFFYRLVSILEGIKRDSSAPEAPKAVDSSDESSKRKGKGSGAQPPPKSLKIGLRSSK